jgi:MioC protein
MTPITILVGTMTGNAEYAAEDMQKILEKEFGHDVEFLLMDKLEPDVFARDGVFLICTSTYGTGDVPENAMHLYEALCTRRPDLSNVRYAVFGLGDSTYDETYNYGGKSFDDILTELGAQRLGERAKHDASSAVPAEDYGRDWVREWHASVREALA